MLMQFLAYMVCKHFLSSLSMLSFLLWYLFKKLNEWGIDHAPPIRGCQLCEDGPFRCIYVMLFVDSEEDSCSVETSVCSHHIKTAESDRVLSKFFFFSYCSETHWSARHDSLHVIKNVLQSGSVWGDEMGIVIHSKIKWEQKKSQQCVCSVLWV